MPIPEPQGKPGLPIAERLALIAKNTKGSPIQRMQRETLLRQIAIVQKSADLTKPEKEFLISAAAHLSTGENLSSADGHRVEGMIQTHAPHITGGKSQSQRRAGA